MLRMNLKALLRHTKIVLQLAYSSTMCLEGSLENIIVLIDSWEYIVHFIYFQIKANLSGHPLILSRPWSSTTNAYIRCRAGDMTITNGPLQKTFTLSTLQICH